MFLILIQAQPGNRDLATSTVMVLNTTLIYGPELWRPAFGISASLRIPSLVRWAIGTVTRCWPMEVDENLGC